jgi:formylglycine-generating enzyme required for sulfatase activity
MITDKSSNRVLRGGSWNNSATNCRVANRNNNDPANRNNNNGFRVVLSQLKRRGGYPLLNRLLFLVLP